ncbi:MAG: prepilin-type N-terminal cleavage/methylation domain-containing protein [Minicystis sp.]
MRKALTLIELLAAMSIGSVIAYTAFAGFRMASTTISTVNRLSLENRLLRAGFFAGVDEVDFWTSYDDPGDATAQPLRVAGEPFAPLSFDADRGPHEPKTWHRGWLWSSRTDTQEEGNYAVLSRIGHPEALRRWKPEEFKAMADTIGYYGLIEYQNADTLFHYYGDDKLTPAELLPGSSKASAKLYKPLDGNDAPRCIWELTYNSAFAMCTGAYRRESDGSIDASKNYRARPGAVSLSHGFFAPDGGSWDFSTMLRYTPEMREWLPTRPANWPRFTSHTWRYVLHSQFFQSVRVRVLSPTTGEAIEMSFWGLGTTLRGARQQRGLDTHVTPARRTLTCVAAAASSSSSAAWPPSCWS